MLCYLFYVIYPSFVLTMNLAADAVAVVTPMIIVQVCSHVAKCYSVAAQFEACRTKIQEISAIVRDISYVLYYRVRTSCDVNLSALCSADNVVSTEIILLIIA